MKILVADDEPVTRTTLVAMLKKWDYEVVAAKDGDAAWAELQRPDAPALAIVDWNMPGLNGDEICRRARAELGTRPLHIILLTAKSALEDKVSGLSAGADDFLTKPFNSAELRARLRVGERVVNLQTELQNRVIQLEKALANVKELQGLLPICACCKKIRDVKGYWTQLEVYLSGHSKAEFTHTYCKECSDKFLRELKLER